MYKLSQIYKLLGLTQTIKLFLQALVKISRILTVTKNLAILLCITDRRLAIVFIFPKLVCKFFSKYSLVYHISVKFTTEINETS